MIELEPVLTGFVGITAIVVSLLTVWDLRSEDTYSTLVIVSGIALILGVIGVFALFFTWQGSTLESHTLAVAAILFATITVYRT